MNQIECPACGEMIPEDSKYCDQCGVELLECVNCKTIGCDPFCPECGKPMVSRKLDKDSSKDKKQEDNKNGDTTIGKSQSNIVLKSRIGDTIIKPEPEAIIGRQDSPYASLLTPMTLISRRHGKFVKRGGRWFIIDFGSTNGTYVNDKEVPANTPVAFAPGDAVDIGTYVFDVIEQ